jgi:uncharacterized protein (TIGR02246 family)
MEGGLEGEIAETRAAFVAALTARDATAASAVYAEDARLLAPSAELMQGRDAVEAFWRAGLDAGIAGVELETLALRWDEHIAYEIGRYELRLEPAEGGTVTDRGKYLLVHERQADGGWRWAVEMFNADVPAAIAGRQPEEGERNA